jgi:hypothetical protein
MTAYKKETSELLQKELVIADSIFDYFETPLEKLCNSLFLYYKKLIDNNSDLYKIVEPNYFFLIIKLQSMLGLNRKKTVR